MFYLFNNKSTSWSVTLTSTASKAFLSSVLSTHPDQQTISPMTPLPLYKYLLLTQFEGLYFKLQTKFFPIRFIAQGEAKQGPVTYSIDQENKVSQIFITSLDSNRGGGFKLKETSEFSRLYSEI